MHPEKNIIQAWNWTNAPSLHPIADGLINDTWLVRCDAKPIAVLQKLNTDIFNPIVHEDIHAITEHLHERGLTTPRLLPTRSGEVWLEEDSGVWRCMTHVGEQTHHKLHDTGLARSAGALVARFHGALTDLTWDFRSVRGHFHDTERFMAHLADTLTSHAKHRLYDPVAALSGRILQSWQAWQEAQGVATEGLPQRIVHGDLKISNIRFNHQTALAIVDLDTLAHGTLDAELGDALRSWCNPLSEDTQSARFDLELFLAAIEGYAEGSRAFTGPTDQEWSSLVPGVARICLELSARFASDALEESYFGFDPRFGTRGDHNLLRARGQFALAQAVLDALPQAEQLLKQARQNHG